MKAGWRKLTLGEVLERTETVNPLQCPDAEFDYIDVSSVSNTTFQIEQTQRLRGAEAPSRARKLVKTNDVIFATIRPTLQRIAIVLPHLDQQVCSTGYFVLRPKPMLDHRFMYYWLFSEEFMGQMELVQKGASYPAVTDKEVRAQEIPIPPLPEQQRIVTLLDEAFDGIATARAHAEKNLQNARAIFESHLQSIFNQAGEDWVTMTIGDTCILKSGTTVSVGIERSAGDTPYVKVAEMTLPGNADGITTSIRFLDKSDVKPGWIIPTGAVIFPKRGGAILTNKKRLVLVDICADLNIMSVIPLNGLSSEFLYLYFLNVDMRKLGTGSSIPQINNYDISPLLISFPKSKVKQFEITQALRATESASQTLADIYQKKITALDALKKSLLHRAFNGDL